MKQQLIIGVLGILALGSFVFLRDLEQSLEVIGEDTDVREIAIARNVKGRYYGKNKRLQYEIVSNSVSEYSNEGGTRFTMADVDGFDDKKQLSWQGRSDVALLSSDKNIITLTGKVQIVDAPGGNTEIRAYGEKMVYYADKGEVIGDESARVESDTMNQTSMRFKLDVNNETIRFNNRVKGQYLPVEGSNTIEILNR